MQPNLMTISEIEEALREINGDRKELENEIDFHSLFLNFIDDGNVKQQEQEKLQELNETREKLLQKNESYEAAIEAMKTTKKDVSKMTLNEVNDELAMLNEEKFEMTLQTFVDGESKKETAREDLNKLNERERELKEQRDKIIATQQSELQQPLSQPAEQRETKKEQQLKFSDISLDNVGNKIANFCKLKDGKIIIDNEKLPQHKHDSDDKHKIFYNLVEKIIGETNKMTTITDVNSAINTTIKQNKGIMQAIIDFLNDIGIKVCEVSVQKNTKNFVEKTMRMQGEVDRSVG